MDIQSLKHGITRNAVHQCRAAVPILRIFRRLLIAPRDYIRDVASRTLDGGGFAQKLGATERRCPWWFSTVDTKSETFSVLLKP